MSEISNAHTCRASAVDSSRSVVSGYLDVVISEFEEREEFEGHEGQDAEGAHADRHAESEGVGELRRSSETPRPGSSPGAPPSGRWRSGPALRRLC
jgi:hypothetical protein